MKSAHENAVQDRIKKNGLHFGNKASNLMELDSLCKNLNSKEIQIAVPQIFPIADTVIKSHLDTHAKEWRKLWGEFVQEQGKSNALTERSKEKLKQLHEFIIFTFKKYPIDENIIKAIKLPADTLFMVRSTGEEDTVDMANPGGNKSVAAVKLDNVAISNAIGVVVGSYVSEKSLTQRLLSGDDISKPSFMPVLIQRMIGEKLNGNDKDNIVVSGVMYAHSNYARIDAAPGHGELIVNSKAPFDTYDVTQEDLVHSEIYQKDSRLIPTEIPDESDVNHVNKKRKLVFRENPRQLKGAPSFSSRIAKEIAKVGEKIAIHYDMPMDIEFVYQPHDKILYLVQARPIPQDVKHKIKPSSISPQLWPLIKKDTSIEKIKCQVVKESGNAAKVITSPEQVVMKKQISEALKFYLNNPQIQGKVRAIIIENDAPSTSHEAAFFNALGITVLQTELQPVKSWLNQKSPVIIVDPQHQHLVNWSNKIKVHANAENEITNEKIITDGLFVSSMSARKTLLPFDYEISDSVKQTIKKYLNTTNKIDIKNIYGQLLQCIDLIEAVKVNDKNETALLALRKVADIFKLIGTSARSKEINAPHFKLFRHAMVSIAEIDACLEKYSTLPADSDNHDFILQRLLDSIAKLKALIINPGKEGLYSDSLVQIAAQNKTLESITNNTVGEQRDYLQEFMKLNSLALKQSTKDQWIEFATECSKNPYKRQLLSRIILLAAQYHFESELINKIFIQIRKNASSQNIQALNDRVLADLFSVVTDSEVEFDMYHIKENERLISSWESKIDDWSQPAKFNRLFDDYSREIVPLTSSIDINDKMQCLTRKAILKQVQRLTDLMDKSIKSLKGSPEYTDQTDILIFRFVKMLNPYLQLMNKWMTNIPDQLYMDWASNIGIDSGFNSKSSMISEIESVFNNKSSSFSASQLEPSGYLSVASARVDTTASFERQFVENRSKLSLEDLFSLMHQNILASTIVLGKDSQIDFEQLPDQMQSLASQLKLNEETRLIGITHNQPVISMEFNIPLNNHSAKLTVDFNTKTHMFTIQWGFFGMNWRNRMNIIAETASLEGMILYGTLPYEPVYNENSRVLEFAWQIHGDQIDRFSSKLNGIIKHYSDLTDNRVSTVHALTDMLERHFKSLDYIKNQNGLTDHVIDKLQTQITNSFNKYDIVDLIIIAPYIMDFLSPDLINNIQITEESIYNNILKLDFARMDLLINKFNIKLNVNFRPSSNNSTLFDYMIKYFSSDDILNYLEKYHPDLSNRDNAISCVLSTKDINIKLLQNLISCGAPVKNISIKAITRVFDKPDIMAALGNPVATWDKDKVTSWLYEELLNGNYSLTYFMQFVKTFKDKINFDFRSDNKHTLLELCISNFVHTPDDVKIITDILSDKRIDLSLHNNLICILFNATIYSDITRLVVNNGYNFDAATLINSIKYLSESSETNEIINLFFNKLSRSKFLETIYNNTDNSNKTVYRQLLENYLNSDDLAFRPSPSHYTLLEKMFRNSINFEIYKQFIDRNKSDLSIHDHLISCVVSTSSPNLELIKYLLSSGARVTNLTIFDMKKIFCNPDLRDVLLPHIAAWSKDKLTSWLYKEISSLNYYNSDMQIISFIEKFKSSIDLNYQPDNGPTLLELCFKYSTDSTNDAIRLANLLANDVIDISRHKHLFSELIIEQYNAPLLKYVMEKGINLGETADFSINTMLKMENGNDAVIKILDSMKPEKLTDYLRNQEMDLSFHVQLIDRYINVLDWKFTKTYPDSITLTLFEILLSILPDDHLVYMINSDKFDFSKIDHAIKSIISQNGTHSIHMLVATKIAGKHAITADDINLILMDHGNNKNTLAECASLFHNWTTKEISDWLIKYRDSVTTIFQASLLQKYNIPATGNSITAATPSYNPGLFQTAQPNPDVVTGTGATPTAINKTSL